MADSAVYQAEKTLKDNEGKFDAALGDEAKTKIETLKKVLENQAATKDEIQPALDTLQETMMKI